MCDPLTIAGIALSGASVAANSIAASQQEAATNRALEQHRAKQTALQQEANALNETSRKTYDGFGQQQEQRSNELGSYLNKQLDATPATPGAEPAQTASNITVQEEARQRGSARAYSRQQAGALGEMRGFGDLLGTLSRQQARSAGEVGQLGGFMSGNSAVLPLQLDAASHAGDTMATIGGIAGGFGKLGLSAGLSGGGFGGGAAGAGGALPSLAGGSAPGTLSLGSVLASRPMAPMTLGQTNGAVPSFARTGNLFGSF